jgi:hypothetical protein
MTSTFLSRIMPPPANPVEAGGSWSYVEERLGVELPEDFKDFIQLYGSGRIDRFVSVLNPFSTRPTLNLLEQSTRQLDALRELHDYFGEQNPFELYPTAGGLLPVAITDNGDVIHWLTSGNPADWTIVVNEARSPDYEQFACNLTAFLEGLLVKSIICRALPSSAFNGTPEFNPA